MSQRERAQLKNKLCRFIHRELLFIEGGKNEVLKGLQKSGYKGETTFTTIPDLYLAAWEVQSLGHLRCHSLSDFPL